MRLPIFGPLHHGLDIPLPHLFLRFVEVYLLDHLLSLHLLHLTHVVFLVVLVLLLLSPVQALDALLVRGVVSIRCRNVDLVFQRAKLSLEYSKLVRL